MLQYAAGEPVYSNNYSLTAGKRGAPSLTGAVRHLRASTPWQTLEYVAIRSRYLLRYM